MSSILLPSVLRQQPRQNAVIDRNNLITRGLMAVNVASQKYDPLTGKRFTDTNASVRTIGSWGYGVDGRVGQSKEFLGGPSISTGTMFTLFITTDPSTEQIIMEIGPDGSFTAGVRGLRFINGQVSSYVRNFFDLITTGGLTANTPIAVAATYAGASSSIYLNGKLAASGTTSDTTSNADTFNIGGITGQTAYNLKGLIPLALVWSRVLMPSEIAALSENPWQIFKAASRKLWAAALVNSYTLTADQGSYAISGPATTLKIARKATASPGSYSINGAQANLVVARRMTAVKGSYAITGVSANLIKGTAPKSLQVASGTYNLTGSIANLRAKRTMTAQLGGYEITGYSTGAGKDYSNFKVTVQYKYMPRSKLQLVRFTT